MSRSQIAVRIPPSLLAELNRYVERTGSSKTDVVINAIAQYMGCAETVPIVQRLTELEAKVSQLTEAFNCFRQDSENGKRLLLKDGTVEQIQRVEN